MVNINVDGALCFPGVRPDYEAAKAALKTLTEGTGAGNAFLGWTRLPFDYDKDEFARIKAAAEKIKKNSVKRHAFESTYRSVLPDLEE